MASLDRLTVGRRAQRDIRLILQESAARWGPEQAASYSAAMDAAIERIAAHPEIGVVQPKFAGVRGVVVEQHLMLYRTNSRGVRIPRVVHQRINFDSVKLR